MFSPERQEQKEPRFTVVVPVKNGAETIQNCLHSLSNQTIDSEAFEVIVVDDGSSDSGPFIAKDYGVKVIHQTSAGPAVARNSGVHSAKSEYILFTDVDCIVPPNWITGLMTPILSESADGSVGRYITNQKNWVARLIQLQLEERYSRMAQFDQIDFVNTGTAAFRRSVLERSPFDVRFKWPGLEDLELSFRLSSQGYRIVYLPDIKVEHKHPESLVKYLKRRFFYAANSFLLYGKYPGKLTSDTSTPHLRRLQLVGLLIGLILLPFFTKSAIIVLVGSQLLAAKFIIRAFRVSSRLGLASPLFVITGNLAFMAGLGFGLISRLLK